MDRLRLATRPQIDQALASCSLTHSLSHLPLKGRPLHRHNCFAPESPLPRLPCRAPWDLIRFVHSVHPSFAPSSLPSPSFPFPFPLPFPSAHCIQALLIHNHICRVPFEIKRQIVCHVPQAHSVDCVSLRAFQFCIVCLFCLNMSIMNRPWHDRAIHDRSRVVKST